MINIQPMLNEDKEARGNPQARRPELVKLIRIYGDKAIQAMKEHDQNVDLGLTDEYKQLETADE